MTTHKQHRCGCITGADFASGVTRNFSKCQTHTPNQLVANQSYYEMLSAIVDGVVQTKPYITRLLSAIDDMNATGFYDTWCKFRFLEIGAGAGNYLPYFQKLYPKCCVIESSHWAACHIERVFGVEVLNAEWGGSAEHPYSRLYNHKFDCILAAHVVEHLDDAPGGLCAIYEALAPGGKAVIIVPDDTDLLNPDHLWFFNTETLVSQLKACGFHNIRYCVRKEVAHENFIYCYCEK